MKLARLSSTIRRWSRNLHRELSFFFAGIVLIYAVSGFLLNHKGDFNAEYDIVNREFRIDDFPAARSEIDKKYVRSILEPLGEAANYTKHYFPEDSGRVPNESVSEGGLFVDGRYGEWCGRI